MSGLWCPDCCGVCRVTRDGGRWQVTVWHAASCPALRTARARRAVDRYLTDVMATVAGLADYGDDIEGRHRRGPAPVSHR